MKITNLYRCTKEPIFLASINGISLRYGMGKNSNIPMKLKRKCARAILMASGDLLSAATKAVKVVPMFAPIINGNAFLKDTLSVATNGTIKEVVVVLE